MMVLTGPAMAFTYPSENRADPQAKMTGRENEERGKQREAKKRERLAQR